MRFIQPSDLAFAGFVCRSSDYVQCVFCSNHIEGWEWNENDYPMTKHEKLFPDCPFVSGKEDKLNTPIFDFQNDVFISAKDSIDDGHMINFLKYHMRRENVKFRKRTKFHLVCGIHHDSDGRPVRTDLNLLKQFWDRAFRILQRYCGTPNCEQKPCENGDKCEDKECKDLCHHASESIWNEYGFEVNDCQISVENEELTDEAVMNLDSLSNELKKANQPNVVIFASCFSYYSKIRNHMVAKGVMSRLNIIKDRGDITGGRLFMLDEQQNKIINAFSGNVKTKKFSFMKNYY